MDGKRPKTEVVTFKVDESVMEAMKGVSNRSAFIRDAILAAMDGVCPVCKGSGVLTPNQKEHWSAFAADHALEECGDCHELRLVCHGKPRPGARAAPHV